MQETQTLEQTDKAKGRVFVYIPSEQGLYINPFFGFGFVNTMDMQGYMEVNEDGLHFWAKRLVLPDGFSLARLYYGINTQKWLLVLESSEIPKIIPPHEQSYPHTEFDGLVDEAIPTVQITRGEEAIKLQTRPDAISTVAITHLALPDFTSKKYKKDNQ